MYVFFCCSLFAPFSLFYPQKDFRNLCIPQRIWIEFFLKMMPDDPGIGHSWKLTSKLVQLCLAALGQERTCCFVVLPGMLSPWTQIESTRACCHHPDFWDEKGGFLRKGAIGQRSWIGEGCWVACRRSNLSTCNVHHVRAFLLYQLRGLVLTIMRRIQLVLW